MSHHRPTVVLVHGAFADGSGFAADVSAAAALFAITQRPATGAALARRTLHARRG